MVLCPESQDTSEKGRPVATGGVDALASTMAAGGEQGKWANMN